MNQLTKVFEGHQVRVVGTPDQPLFVLSDVCNVLEIGNPSDVKKRLEDGVVSIEGISDKFNRIQKVTVINEDGLYDVVLDSRKPIAKKFRKWVTSEVLPAIRNTGFYQVQPKTELELIQMTATEMIKTNERIDTLEYKINNQMTLDYGQQQALLNQKNIRVEQLWGRVDFSHTVYDTKKKVHAKAWRDLKNAFGASSYKDIRKKDFEEAVAFIKHWRPAMIGG